MQNDTIKDRVNNIFVELFELKESDLSEDKLLFEQLGLDSLDAIDMAIRFQKEFHMKPSHQEIQSLRTLGDIYSLVARYSQLSQESAI